LPLLVVNASLALYVTRVGRGRNALGELVGRRWQTARRALTDAALALLAAALIVLTEYAWTATFGAPNRAWSDALLPTTSLERAAWVVVAVAVGASEELVYRGYLQHELGVLARSRAVGLIAQSALFAIAHGQQGAGAVARTFVYGIGFGVLAHARRSLLPGMIAHVGLDLTAGLVHH
jgi:membrane protease YdiL (CAAX protease family)